MRREIFGLPAAPLASASSQSPDSPVRAPPSAAPVFSSQEAMVPLKHGKSTLTTNYWALCGILYALVLGGSSNYALVASSSDGSCKLNVDIEKQNSLPGTDSNGFITGYYIEKQNSLPGVDFNGFMASETCPHDCQRSADRVSGELGLSALHYEILGEGSHRRLTSTMTFNFQPDAMSWFAAYFCEAVVIARLPVEVFADPFELQHLVERQVYLDAAVFGDTNLELPSALSSRSVVEIHMDFEHSNLRKRSVLVLELPLHARYPPFDASGYSRVEIGKPDLLVRCRPKSSENDTSNWKIANLANAISGNDAIWSVPCGVEWHTGFVSIVTFVSAFFSAVLLVLTTVYFSKVDDCVKHL